MVSGGKGRTVVDPARAAGETAAVNPYHHRERLPCRLRRGVDVQEQAVLKGAGGRHTGGDAAGLRTVVPRLGRWPDAAPGRERLRRPPLVRAGWRGGVGDAEELAGAIFVEAIHEAVVGAHDKRQWPRGMTRGRRTAGGKPG